MEPAPASLPRRFGALLIDWISCLLIAGAFAKPTDEPWLAPGVFVVVYALFLGFFGQTLGMRLLRIRCVSMSTGRPLGVPRALLRAVIMLPLVTTLIMDENKRGLHDRASGSFVQAG